MESERSTKVSTSLLNTHHVEFNLFGQKMRVDKRQLFVGVIVLLVMVLLLFVILFARRGSSGSSRESVVLSHIDADAMRGHVRFLSSDLLEGRGPGTRGEELAVGYMEAQFATHGLRPYGDEVDGSVSFRQRVAMVGSTHQSAGELLRVEAADGGVTELAFQTDYVAATDTMDEAVSIDAGQGDVVFVGFGISAADDDWAWDDYKDVDVSGKVLIGLVNQPDSWDDGGWLQYYGRWMYKYEEARRRGAEGMILVHTDEMAGYPWAVISNGGSVEAVMLSDFQQTRMKFRSWVSSDAADRIARACGSSLAQWIVDANSGTFTATTLPISLALHATYSVRGFTGFNVLGMLPGTVTDEVVYVTAHHDHLGIGPPDASGDTIYNGALDNASGLALLLELVDAFSHLTTPLRRSIVFASVTAEESGLLGSQFLVEHLTDAQRANTIANVNFDGGGIWGRTRDVVGIGAPFSSIEHVLRDAAEDEGMSVSPDNEPGQGHLYRSDQLHFFLAKVPCFHLDNGCKYEGKADDFCHTVIDEYNELHYHQPSDEYSEAWDMGGMAQLARVASRVLLDIGDSAERMAYYSGPMRPGTGHDGGDDDDDGDDDDH